MLALLWFISTTVNGLWIRETTEMSKEKSLDQLIKESRKLKHTCGQRADVKWTLDPSCEKCKIRGEIDERFKEREGGIVFPSPRRASLSERDKDFS